MSETRQSMLYENHHHHHQEKDVFFCEVTYRSDDAVGSGDHVGNGVGPGGALGPAVKRLQVRRNVPNSGRNVTPNLGVFGGDVDVEPVGVHHVISARARAAVIIVRLQLLVLEVLLLLLMILRRSVEKVGQVVIGKNTWEIEGKRRR